MHSPADCNSDMGTDNYKKQRGDHIEKQNPKRRKKLQMTQGNKPKKMKEKNEPKERKGREGYRMGKVKRSIR